MEPRLALTVSLDDETTDVDIDPSRPVTALIDCALEAFDVRADRDQCHLEGGRGMYFSWQLVRDIVGDDEEPLALRLPL